MRRLLGVVARGSSGDTSPRPSVRPWQQTLPDSQTRSDDSSPFSVAQECERRSGPAVASFD